MLKVVNITKNYGGITAVNNVSTEFTDDNVTCIIGSNGAGKTTLTQIISGRVQPSSGRVIFKGEDVTALAEDKRVKRGIALSFQIPQLYDNMTLLDNITANILIREGRNNSFAPLSGQSQVRNEAINLLTEFGFQEKMETLASNLSHGDRKMLDILLTLALRPDLALLDEPTSGVATKEKDDLMRRIMDGAKDVGCSFVLIEHDMDIVRKYADEVIVMNDGRILKKGTVNNVLNSETGSILADL